MAGTQTSPVDKELNASRKAAMDALDKLLEAKDHFRSAAGAAGLEMKDEAIDQLMQGRAKAEKLGKQAGNYVHDKPVTSLAIAFLGGILLSQLLGRK